MTVLTVLFSVEMPVNCYRIMIEIMKLTNLDVINTQEYIDKIFTFKVETEPLDAKFSDAGYESSNFIIELGPLFFIIMTSITFFLARLLMLYLIRPCGTNCMTKRLRQRLSIGVVVIRFMIEGCIELGLCALIAIKMATKDQFKHL